MTLEAQADARVEFWINGRSVRVSGVEPMRRLSDVLRDDLGLTGTKVGCEAGDCGACTVRLDGRQVDACLVPLAQVQGTRIDTVEGLAIGGGPSDLQAAFLEHGAAQCGICTPGMILAAIELLTRAEDPTEDDVRVALAGNLCRCTGYMRIFESVLEAAKRR